MNGPIADRLADHLPERCTAFKGRRLLASGSLDEAALAAKAASEGAAEDAVLDFDDATGRFMPGIGGDLPGYEEATRALFADDRSGPEERTEAWPEDVRARVLRLAFPAADPQWGSVPSTGREGTP